MKRKRRQPPKKRLKVQLCTWLEPDQATRLRLLAAREGRPVAEIMREALEDTMAKYELTTRLLEA